MTTRKNDIVKEIVYDTVARHIGLKRQNLHETASIEDPKAFYRIIVDIEQQLDLSSLKGDWCFDEGTIRGLVNYYTSIIEDRS